MRAKFRSGTRIFSLVEHQARAMKAAGRLPSAASLERRAAYPRDKGQPECERAWILVDAYGEAMGRLASRLAYLMQGKHKPIYQRHRDVGDNIVVVNAAKVVLTGRGMDTKKYYHHTQYPGGLRTTPVWSLFEANPVEPLRRAIFGMLPHNRLRRQRMDRLRMYPGNEHAQAAEFAATDLAFRAVLPADEGPARLERIASPESA